MKIPLIDERGEETGYCFTVRSAEGSCGDSTYTLYHYHSNTPYLTENVYGEPETLKEALATARGLLSKLG